MKFAAWKWPVIFTVLAAVGGDGMRKYKVFEVGSKADKGGRNNKGLKRPNEEKAHYAKTVIRVKPEGKALVADITADTLQDS